MPLTAEQKKMYMAMQLKGETVRRTPGQIAGQQFIVDGIEDCVVEVLDHCAQVTVDDAKRCTITIGPCEDSLFVRDCEDCVVHAACRQLRTRNCVRCTFYLWVLTDPIIESSHSCEFGEWHTAYPLLDAHFKAANLNTSEENLCHKIYDFTPDEPHAPHWTKAPPQLERVIKLQQIESPPVNPATPKIVAPPPDAEKTAAVESDTSVGAEKKEDLCELQAPHELPVASMAEEDDLSELQGLQIATDGSVIKSFQKRGSGRLRPAIGDRVNCHVVALLENGEVFASTREDGTAPLQFVIGDTTVEGRMDVTDIPSGLNEGLVTMARGEVARFTLAASKAHGDAGLTTGDVLVPPGATVEYEVELLNWAQDLQKDGGLLLTRELPAGDSGASVTRLCPSDLMTVRMRYTSREAASQVLIEDCSSGDGAEFMIDDGAVMLGLELAAKQMQAGEKACLEINTVGPGGVLLPYGYASMGPDHPHAAVTGSLVLELELLPFTPPKALDELTGAERLAEVERVRELGVRKFQGGQVARARRRFERALTVASHRNLFAAAAAAGTGVGAATAEESERLLEHRAALSNNIAACCVKLEEWEDTLTATATALQLKPEDTKALYRQGLAYNRLGSYDRAKKSLKAASRLEAAKDKQADRALLRLIRTELNGVTSQGLERNKEKEKETWGGKLQSTEPQQAPPAGLLAKAANAIGSAVGVQRKPAKGSGESPLSPKKKRKKKSGQQAAAQAETEQAMVQPEPPGAGPTVATKHRWWALLRRIAPAAGVLLLLLFMLRRKR